MVRQGRRLRENLFVREFSRVGFPKRPLLSLESLVVEALIHRVVPVRQGIDRPVILSCPRILPPHPVIHRLGRSLSLVSRRPVSLVLPLHNLEDRVLKDRLLHLLGQVQPVEHQQVDGLLKLRGHDHLLRQTKVKLRLHEAPWTMS